MNTTNENKVLGNLLHELGINSPEQIEDRLSNLSTKLLSTTNDLCDRCKKRRASYQYFNIKNKLMRFFYRQTPLGKCVLMTVEQRLENENTITLLNDELGLIIKEMGEVIKLRGKIKTIEDRRK